MKEKYGGVYPRYWISIVDKDTVIIEEYKEDCGIVLYSSSNRVSNGNQLYISMVSNVQEIDRTHLPKSLQHFDIEELRKNEPQYFY